MEEYVEAIITGDNDDLPAPRSEREREFYEAAKRGLGGGGSGGTTYNTLIPETTITADDWHAYEDGYMQEIDFMFNLNESYKVVWNGEEYRTTVTDVSEDETLGYALGNIPILMEAGDNGIPFLIVTSETDGVKMLMVADINALKTGEFGTTTFSIECGDDKTKPLKFSFSPIDVNAGMYTFTHTYSELKTAFLEGRRIIANYTFGDGRITTSAISNSISVSGTDEGILMDFGKNGYIRYKPDGSIAFEQ